MKKTLKKIIGSILLFVPIFVSAQTEGISYQAVLLNPSTTELPGHDTQNDLLRNHRVNFEFTILSSVNNIIYQETQITFSDTNGLVNLIIGQGIPVVGSFQEIEWNGELRILTVKLDVNGGNNFAPLSSQELLYLPFAVHRNISATGNVDIEGSLQVEGEANLTDDINIDGNTNISGLLTVDGGTVLNINTANNKNPNPRALTVSGNTLLGEELTVDGATIMNNSLEITNNSPVYMTGSLTTDGETTINNELTVVENTILESSLTVEGYTIIENSLRVEENTVLENTLTVSESSTFMSDLNVRGETAFSGRTSIDGPTDITSDLDVYGSTLLRNSLTVNNFSPTRLTGKLDVDLDTNLNSDLIVDGSTTMHSALDITNASPVNFTGTLNVDGVTDLNNNLIVDGSTTLNSSLDVTNTSPVNLTGTLNVDGVTDLNNNLIVDGSTTLNSTLSTSGNTAVGGTLTVSGATQINNTLNATGNTNLGSALTVTGATQINNTLSATGNTDLGNTLTVAGSTQLNSTLNVSNNTTLSGTLTVANTADFSNRVTISAGFGGDSNNYNNYPLRVQGSANGIAVKVTAGTPNNSNNFMTFFDSGGNAVGAIEGETWPEKILTEEYLYDTAVMAAELVLKTANVAASFVPVCTVGLGAGCGPDSGGIAIAAAELVLAGAALATYNTFANKDMGLTYSSGGADYAEYLKRKDINEKMKPGDIVGVTNGEISKFIDEKTQKILVVSSSPAVLGNLKPNSEISQYEKVAFLGQVPVRVNGVVTAGDYILPSGKNDGTGIAVSKNNIKVDQYSDIIGVAWSSTLSINISKVNMAIGLNSNDLAQVVMEQENKISLLKKRIDKIEELLGIVGLSNQNTQIKSKVDLLTQEKKSEKTYTRMKIDNIIDFEKYIPAYISREIFDSAVDLIINGQAYPNTSKERQDLIFDKLKNDQSFNDEIFSMINKYYNEEYLKIKKQF